MSTSYWMSLSILFFAMASSNTMGSALALNSTEIIPTSLVYVDESVNEFDIDTSSSGWAWYPLRWTWWLIAQAILAILGIIGNGIVIIVIYQRYFSIRSTDVLIGALAISDLLTSIFLFPIPWAKQVPSTILGHLYCKLLYPSFFLWDCITASTYILVGICIERYVAVVYPLYFNRVNSRWKTSIFVLCLWLFSILQDALYTFFVFIHDESIGYCRSTIMTELGRQVQAYFAISSRLFIPILIMLVTQILIARSLHIQAKRFQGMVSSGKGDSNPSFHVTARNRIVKLTLIVVLVYVVTWTPNQIAYLCFNLGYISPSYRGSPLHRILTLVGFLNSCVNPVIYGARNPEFRKAVRNLFMCSSLEEGMTVFSGTSSSNNKNQRPALNV